jgi:DNA-binding PadR family transcriptional regulator
MSLRYALLALLTAQPMTGYDLAKAFHGSVGHVWHAPDSQIYPEMRRMEKENLVTGTPVTWGTKGIKTEYGITPAGEAALRDWIDVPLEYALERNPAHLRAAYFEWAEPESARAQLRAHVTHYEEQRAMWQAQLESIRDHSHPILAKRLEGSPAAEWDRITAYKLFAYEGLVARADQEIAWATRGLRLVDQLEGRVSDRSTPVARP